MYIVTIMQKMSYTETIIGKFKNFDEAAYFTKQVLNACDSTKVIIELDIDTTENEED